MTNRLCSGTWWHVPLNSVLKDATKEHRGDGPNLLLSLFLIVREPTKLQVKVIPLSTPSYGDKRLRRGACYGDSPIRNGAIQLLLI